MAAQPAFAANLEPPQGMTSYTQFIKAIQEHLIDRVRIAADGRSADFLNIDGLRGSVNLLSDPNLLKILTDNGVDIAAMPNDPSGNVLFGILQ